MRKLQTSDVFALARVIRASGARAELSKIIAELTTRDDDDLNIEEIGITGFLTIAECASGREVEKMIYELLAGVIEIEPQDVARMGLDEIGRALRTIAEENDVKRFFKFASDMTRRS